MQKGAKQYDEACVSGRDGPWRAGGRRHRYGGGRQEHAEPRRAPDGPACRPQDGPHEEIARLYQVSYPTVRLRLDKLIQKIELADQHEEEPFTAFIKGLAVDSRIDVETAKQIIDKYQKERQRA